MNDWEVLDRHQSGDRAAIDQLVRKHINFVYSTARRLVSATEADDVVQAVFLLLTQKAASISRRGTLTGWLYRATRYCCSNLRRVEARRRRHEMEAAMKAAPPPTPEFADAAWLEALDAALDRLNATDRDAVLLHYLQQQTFEETAQAIGITPEAARKRTGRAMEKLRTHFLKKGYAVGSVAAVGGSLQAATRSASAATINASLLAAHGKAGAAIVSVAHATSQVMLVAQIKTIIVSGIAAALALTLGIWAVTAMRQRPAVNPVQQNAAGLPQISAPSQSSFVSALPRIELDAQPSEAEAKRILKIRLQIMSNVIARYTVHTEYPPPPGGWPLLLASTPSIYPVAGAALPFSLDRPATTLFASGSTDTSRTISFRDGRIRYERTLIKADRELPLPSGAGEFHSQVFISAPLGSPSIERLFLDAAGKVLVSDILTGDSLRAADRLPEPDLEAILALRLPAEGTASRQPAALITPENIDNLTISFSDDNAATASMTVNHIPVDWSLDRSKGYAATAFHYGDDITMTVNEFQNISGVVVPLKISTAFKNSQVAERIWRKDALTVTALQLHDPANADGLYKIQQPIGAPRADAVRRTDAMEVRLGGESFDAASVVSPLTTPSGSPSTPARREDAYGVARHEQFVQQAKQGQIDLLLLGDKPIEDWPAQAAAWERHLAPHRAAAFGITADRVENLLWRINHGELEGLSPKVIVLFIGGTDAAIDGRFAYGPGGGGRSDAFTFSNRLREDSPDAIVTGIQEIIRTIREKSPASKILLIGLCHSVFNRTGVVAMRFQQRAATINTALAKLDNGTMLRYLDLAPAFMDGDGRVAADIQRAADVGGTYQATYQRWGQAMEPILEEMW